MRNAVWIKCIGEAHSPVVAGHIDHCPICMPFWDRYPVCPECKYKLTDKGYCRQCGHHFNIEEQK